MLLYPPLLLYSDGKVAWFPGGIISASCSLDMTYFPFDHQICSFYFYSTNGDRTEMEFRGKNSTFPDLKVIGEWEVMKICVQPEQEDGGTDTTAAAHYMIILRRRPTSFMITVMMPVCLLSLLNFLVFVIPVTSGEKISYGITVLLAQSVYMTTLTTTLPRSSGNLPRVTIYVFCLLIISAFNVLVSIVTMLVHNLDQKQQDGTSVERSRTGENSSMVDLPGKGTFNIKLNHFQAAHEAHRQVERSIKEHRYGVLKGVAVKWINAASLFVSSLAWITVTMWFFF